MRGPLDKPSFGERFGTGSTVARRHCWVRDPPGWPGRWPGLLIEWARRDGRWWGRVACVVGDDGQAALLELWLPGEALADAAQPLARAPGPPRADAG